MDERDQTTGTNRMANPNTRAPGRPRKSPTAEVIATETRPTRVKCSQCGHEFAPQVLRTVRYGDDEVARKVRCNACGHWHWLP